MAIQDRLPFNPILLEINLNGVTFFHFARVFYCDLGLSVFEPLPIRVLPYPYKEVFDQIEVSDFQYSVMNNHFIEFARRMILKSEGYEVDQDGFYRINGAVPNIHRELYAYS